MVDRSLNYGRHLVERFLREARPFASVLDLGAGRGADLQIARRVEPTAALHAIEFEPHNVECLRRQGVGVHQIDLERQELSFADGSIDVVIANQVFEHLKELFFVCHQVTRCLKVGGRLIVGVPNLASLHNRLLLLAGRQPTPLKNNSAHIRGFTRSDLVRFMESCFPGGYRLAGWGGSNFYPFPPPLARPLAQLFPSLAWGMFLAFEKTRPYNGEFLEYLAAQRLATNFFLGASGSEPGAGEEPRE